MSTVGDCVVYVTALVTGEWIFMEHSLTNWKVAGYATLCSVYIGIPLLYFSLSFISFTYFLLLSIPSLSTRIVPLRFQAGGCRRRPNLGLVSFFLFFLCVLFVLSVFLS